MRWTTFAGVRRRIVVSSDGRLFVLRLCADPDGSAERVCLGTVLSGGSGAPGTRLVDIANKLSMLSLCTFTYRAAAGSVKRTLSTASIDSTYAIVA